MKKIFTQLLICCFCISAAHAQSVCDSLDVKLTFHPFSDSLLQVIVDNHSQEFFNYPAFMVHDGNDTIAIEQPNLFGLGASSAHNLDIIPGKLQGTTVSGNLSFYSHMFDSLECTWPLVDHDLCPAGCEPVSIFLGNTGGAMFTGTANYEIRNSLGQAVTNGTFNITLANQYDEDTVCLLPGDYTLHISQNTLTSGGAKNLGLTQHINGPTPGWYLVQNTDTVFSFSYYKQCATPVSVGHVAEALSYNMTVQNGQLIITGTLQQPGTVMIYAADGKLVSKENMQASRYTKDVSRLSAGIYIVQVWQQGRASVKKVYIGNR